ncbi:hypothetical protein [Streptomyces sp. NPDC058108]|uniref:hypothetical protein n=1 Tax=Streptomyces sp. NPDC058108 TaxID=3346344 RepID=UPI0036E22C53
MNVDDVVAEKIAAAARRAAAEKQRRAELAAARRAGLARRHARKLFNLARSSAYSNQSVAPSGA